MSRRLESISFALIVLGVAAWRFGATTADRDLWGHIRFGQDKIEALAYISVDRYSYLTEGQTWFNHEWLSEVLMALTYDAWGSAGLSILKAALALVVVAVLIWWLNREGLEPLRTTVVMMLGVLALTPTFGTFRPQMFTVAMFVSLLLLLESVEGGRSGALLLLPPLFLLWINLHGGVLAGFVVLATWAALFALVGRGATRWRPLLAAAASLLALVVNPNGLAHLAFLIRTTTVSRPEIQDWKPIDLTSAVGLVYLVLFALLVGAIVVSRRNLRYPIVVPLLGLSVLPLLASRHLQLFVPALVILGGSYLVTLSRRLGTARSGAGRTSTPVALVLSGVAIVGSVLVVRAIAVDSSCIQVTATQFEFPMRAVHALRDSKVEGNTVVTFNWGEYLIWHTGPQNQVSIDGRRETVYPDEVLRANLEFIDGGPEWDRLLQLAPTDVVLVPTASPGARLLADDSAWEVGYSDDLASIYLPVDAAIHLNSDLSLPVDGDGACFPA